MNFKSFKPMQLIIAPFHRLGQALKDYFKKTFHHHEWDPSFQDAVAYYSKRDSEADRIAMKGMVFRCHCGEHRFYPYSGDLPPVEVTRDTSEDL